MTTTYNDIEANNAKENQLEPKFDQYNPLFLNMKMTQNVLYHLTTHIPIFYQGILKLFSGSRRSWASVAHQDAYSVGKKVARVAFEGLVCEPFCNGLQ